MLREQVPGINIAQLLHVIARELCYREKLSTSILFIPVDGSTREVSSEGKYELPRRSDAKYPDKRVT